MGLQKSFGTKLGYTADFSVLTRLDVDYKRRRAVLTFELYKDEAAYLTALAPVDITRIEIADEDFDDFEIDLKSKNVVKTEVMKAGKRFDGATDTGD